MKATAKVVSDQDAAEHKRI